MEILAAALRTQPGITASILRASPTSALAGLKDSDVAVFLRGPGAKLSDADRSLLRDTLATIPGLVLIGARAESWPADIGLNELLGATPAGPFAGGATLAVIDLYPHPILTGVTRLETRFPVARYDKLAPDAQMFIEGTVGEATTPLAWVRRRTAGRLCHVALAGSTLLADAQYQRLLGNAVRWSAGRPVPGAQPIVQRTFMPDSYPGAFAITLPNGPGVCLDPVRGGINFIWDGDFVDLRPRWLTKVGEPARVFGDVFYRETQWQPLRGGAPDAAPDFHLRGYTLRDGQVEFHYEIAGREVHERLSAGADGGLVRTFRVGPGRAALWLQLEPQPTAEVTVRGLSRDGDLASFTSTAAGEFAVEVRRKAVVPR